MTSAHRFSDKELGDHFREQLEFLENSASAYDTGRRSEAKRLASVVFTLCHDPPTSKKNSLSKSLLGQLGLKKKLQFLSTARPLSNEWIPWTPLAMMKADNIENFHFVPYLDVDKDSWRNLPFSKWWEEKIYKTERGKYLSRKNLVFIMRSQDGGSHVDEQIRDSTYQSFRSLVDTRLRRKKITEDEKPGIRIAQSGSDGKLQGFEPVPDAHVATMRQIAFEVAQSVGAGLLKGRDC